MTRDTHLSRLDHGNQYLPLRSEWLPYSVLLLALTGQVDPERILAHRRWDEPREAWLPITFGRPGLTPPDDHEVFLGRPVQHLSSFGS